MKLPNQIIKYLIAIDQYIYVPSPPPPPVFIYLFSYPHAFIHALHMHSTCIAHALHMHCTYICSHISFQRFPQDYSTRSEFVSHVYFSPVASLEPTGIPAIANVHYAKLQMTSSGMYSPVGILMGILLFYKRNQWRFYSCRSCNLISSGGSNGIMQCTLN